MPACARERLGTGPSAPRPLPGAPLAGGNRPDNQVTSQEAGRCANLSGRHPARKPERGTAMDLGLLLLRLALAAILYMHATQKLFGWFSGQGLDRAGALFETLGQRPGRQMAK